LMRFVIRMQWKARLSSRAFCLRAPWGARVDALNR